MLQKILYNYFFLFIICAFSHAAFAQRRPKYQLETISNKSSIENSLPESIKKEIYRIDFLLPLYVDSLPSQLQVLKTIPTASQTGVNIYEGILMAIDSLEKAGILYCDIYVHDIGNTPVQTWIDKGLLDSTDIIVGALYSADIPIVANFAQERKINFLSMLSPSDGDIKGNPYFIISQPPLDVNLKRMVAYAEFNKSYLNTVLISGNTKHDEEPLHYIKENVNRIVPNFALSSYENINLDKLKNLLDDKQKNLIYTTALSPQDATLLLEALSKLDEKYQLEVIGFPTWKGLPILTSGKLKSNITVYLSYPYRFDEEVEKRLRFRNQYEKFKRGLPTELVYRGYEITLWISDLLNQYGTVFNSHLAHHPAFCTDYKIELKKEEKQEYYYENTQLYFYKYNESVLKIIE